MTFLPNLFSDVIREAFEGGWFHTGDLAVHHGNGRIEIKDRSKDVIISGNSYSVFFPPFFLIFHPFFSLIIHSSFQFLLIQKLIEVRCLQI